MSRKAVHKIGRLEGRERLWELMTSMRTFTVKQLLLETSGYDPATIRHYANSLVAAGYLKATRSQEKYKPVVYELLREVPEPPRVRKDGTPVTQGQGRENMWRAMRILKSFTLADLVAAASTEDHRVKVSEAKYYLRYLVKAGYLRKQENNYVMVKFTGPKPPQVQRIHQLWDPNLKKVVWPEDKENEKHQRN